MPPMARTTASRILLAALALGLAGAPALANCTEPVLEMAIARPALDAVWAGLSRQYAFPWGGAHVWGKVQGDRIELALPYDRLTAKHKRLALDMLKLGGTPASIYKPSPYDQLVSQSPMTPFSVYAYDGRLVSMPYDGCTRLYFFTEYDRARLRSMQRTLPPRKMRFPLPEATNTWVTRVFWETVGRRQTDILHMTWVPEAGHYEIVVSMEARLRYRNRLEPFWWQAPLDLHYVVLDADGEWLEERGFAPAPWPW